MSVYKRLLQDSIQKQNRLKSKIKLERTRGGSSDWNKRLSLTGKLDYINPNASSAPPLLFRSKRSPSVGSIRSDYVFHFASLPPQENRFSKQYRLRPVIQKETIKIPSKLPSYAKSDEPNTMDLSLAGFSAFSPDVKVPDVKRTTDLCPCISPITYYYDCQGTY